MVDIILKNPKSTIYFFRFSRQYVNKAVYRHIITMVLAIILVRGKRTYTNTARLFLDSRAVREAMDAPDTCVINALDADIHRGDNPRYGRPGRIPASVNVPASTLVDPDTNTFVSSEQAASIFREVGADPTGRTVLYCGGGIAATLDAFVLNRLGYDDLSIYDASMSEWARDESLPIETD